MMRLLRTLLVLFCVGQASNASEPYFEIGMGTSQFYSSTDFFDGVVSSKTSFSIFVNFMFAENFSDAGSFLQFHFGLKNTYLAGFDVTTIGVMNVIYPIIRLEMPRFYLGFGVSPFVMKRSGLSVIGLDFTRDPSDLAFLAEVGFVWRIVPFFYIGFETGLQTVKTTNGFSPMPAASASIQLRFMLGDGDAGGSSARPYDGWRYPFGIQL
jgi:hypothetical protein